METIKEKKENNSQITFRDPEIFSALKKLSENNSNSGIGPEAKKLLKEALENLGKNKMESAENKSILKPTVEKTTSVEQESEISVSEKLDVIAGILGKLLIQQEAQDSQETEELISQEIENAVSDHEEKLRAENLMLPLPDSIKSLFFKLFEFRKKNKIGNEENVAQLFLVILSYYVENDMWNSKPDGFPKELKKATIDFLNSPKETPVVSDPEKNQADQKENDWL